MSDPISQDIAYTDALVTNSQSSFQVLSANAQRGLDLKTALLTNPEFIRSKNWVDTFICAYRDYKQSLTSNTVSFTANSNYKFYGDNTKYHGNLNNFWIATSVTQYVITTNSFAAGQNITLSAGSAYYNLPNRITFTPPVTTVSTDTLFFHANRFAFICQYIWSNPNDVTQTKQISAIPYTDIFPIKNGINFNATSLLAAATAMKTDSSFYLQKQQYLSTLI
tara:strand:- start:2047 stop:2712 length:666 start_codon:yes stop_codon:yes gene_type:complete